MAQRSHVRRAPPRPIYASPSGAPLGRQHRGRRRLLVLLALVCLTAFAGWEYLLHVYAPGLRSEVATLPVLVRDQVTSEGGTYVSIDAMSPYLQQSIVAIEDRRFYEHHGIDPQAVVRSLLINLQSHHIDQGGSTLEEQLAKRAIVHTTDTIHDKLRVMALAWAIDQEFSKRQILELYLNDAYYGQGAYGAQSAARVYFGTDAARLTLAQAAFLAALPQAPSIYGAHPLAAGVTDRWRTVLRDMESLGDITAAEEQQAEAAPLSFALPNP